MPCYSPLPAWRYEGLRPAGTKPVIGRDAPEGATTLELPCGKCLGCKTRRAKDWALRCNLEYQQHERTAFTTLTYDDDHLPVILRRDHLQKFLKRLRRSQSARLRFFASGEYGERTYRAHYHAILFGIGADQSDYIQSKWKFGHTYTVEATPAGISYVAGYVAKKLDNALLWEQLEPHAKPFIQMTRGGRTGKGLAHHASKWPQSWRIHAVVNGYKTAVPRYLHQFWKDQATTEELEQTLNEKLKYRDSLPDTHQYLEAAEKAAIARQQQQAQKRRYA